MHSSSVGPIVRSTPSPSIKESFVFSSRYNYMLSHWWEDDLLYKFYNLLIDFNLHNGNKVHMRVFLDLEKKGLIYCRLLMVLVEEWEFSNPDVPIEDYQALIDPLLELDYSDIVERIQKTYIPWRIDGGMVVYKKIYKRLNI